MSGDNEDDRKVKDMLDPATRADLERWFGLPSFEQLADQPASAAPLEGALADPAVQKVAKQREAALAEIDPALVAAIYARTDDNHDRIIRFKASLDVHVKEDFGTLDEVMLQRAMSIAEPREYELGDELRDAMSECTPQALLRDLHRPELDFDKQFEIVDITAELRVDAVSEVKTAMATSWKLPPLEASPLIASTGDIAEIRRIRAEPWTSYLHIMRNRQVRE
jgi:hypothetical protein